MQIEDGTVIKARSLAERSFIATSFSLLNFYLQTPCNFAATLLFLHESKTQIENTLKWDYNLVFPDFLTSHFPISCWGIWDFSARYPQARYIYIYISYPDRCLDTVWTASARPSTTPSFCPTALLRLGAIRSQLVREKRGSLRAEQTFPAAVRLLSIPCKYSTYIISIRIYIYV